MTHCVRRWSAMLPKSMGTRTAHNPWPPRGRVRPERAVVQDAVGPRAATLQSKKQVFSSAEIRMRRADFTRKESYGKLQSDGTQ